MLYYIVFYIYINMFFSIIAYIYKYSLVVFIYSFFTKLRLVSGVKSLSKNVDLYSLNFNTVIFFNLFFNIFFATYLFYLVWFFSYDLQYIYISNVYIHLIINLDWLSVSLLFLVTYVSLIVHIYSLWYMKHDFNKDKFLMLLSCFTGSMIFLILGGNLLCTFIGWEMVGVSSFLLISFWETRKEALRAACKALFLNKIGDIFFFIAVVLLFKFTGSFVIDDVVKLDTNSLCLCGGRFYIFDVMTSALFIAAAAKSAQFGLHMWLIDAMEGPTPVSALIHAATMVTAGVFLMIRCQVLFNFCSVFLLTFISFWGILTAFIGGLLAIFQFDIKKIIAYSTMSQLGYMFSVVPFDVTLALFHLLNHGWFKALLFLASGVVIHFCNNEQDIRRVKAWLVFQLPITFFIFCFGSLAMIALPLTSGFFSKDLIYEMLVFNKIYIYYFLLLICTGFFTIIYSVRLVYFVFFKKGFYKINYVIQEEWFIVLFVYIPLTFLTLCSGYVFIFLLKQVSFFYDLTNLIFLNILVIFCVILYFFYFKNLLTVNKIKFNGMYLLFYSFLLHRLFIDLFFNKSLYYSFVYLCWFFYTVFEMGWIYYFLGPSFFLSTRYMTLLCKTLELFNSFKLVVCSFMLVTFFSLLF